MNPHRNPCLILITLCVLLLAPVAQAALIQSPSDRRQYDAFTLPNQLQVVVISDPDTDKAAASLNVRVGSADNPPDRPGLAHFLEHMLFLGTEKYPEAGEYQQFISANGGSHNAFTAFENTNYFFDVQAQALPQALDRFAQFFIAPLFSPEYVDRELHAVHSEYSAKRRDDGRRLYVASKLAMNPDHPYSRFFVGNLDTLADRPGDPIREDLLRFYQQHYSANLMTLAVIGRQSTAQLRQLVEDTFAAVPNHNRAERVISQPLYRPEQLPVQLDVKTLKQTRQLTLSFPIPPLREHWRIKPAQYLASLIGYEGEGSLLSQLKAKGWARGLGASTGINLPEGATFDVNIELTAAGLEHYDQVVQLFFTFVEELRRNGVREDLYDEEKRLAATEFRFLEPREPIHEVMALAARMSDYPTAHLLDAPYRFDAFDPDLIRTYLEPLRPDNLILTRAAQDLPTDQTTARYQIDYRLGTPEHSALTQWSDTHPIDGLHVRGPNPFIPEDLELIPATAAVDKPQRIWQQNGSELWFMPDQTFKQPRADLYLALLSDAANATPRAAALSSLYARMIRDRLNETLYDARLAGLSAQIYAHLQGISVRISGYNPRQGRLLDAITEAMSVLPTSQARFNRMKQELLEEYANAAKERPYNQTFSALYSRLMPQWSAEEKKAALEPLTLTDLQDQVPRLYAGATLRAFAFGNLSADEAREMAQKLSTRLLTDAPLAPPQLPVVQLPAGERLYDTLDVEHQDSALTLYLQGSDTGLPARAEVALLAEILQTPFYSQLRTEQQLGYIVFANYMPLRAVPGLVFVVQSPVANPLQLEQAYDHFLDQSAAQLQQLTESDLERFRQSLISRINRRDNSISERSARFWRELDRGNTAFDTREQLTRAVSAVTARQLSERLAQLRQRQLALRSFGSHQVATPTRDDAAQLEMLRAERHFVPGSLLPAAGDIDAEQALNAAHR